MPRGRRSKLEDHPARDQIISDLARRVPIRKLCEEHHLSRDVIYRYLRSHSHGPDRKTRAALRALKRAQGVAVDAASAAGDLPERLGELAQQLRVLKSAQAVATASGDLQRVANLADAIGRVVRHQAALSEQLRLRQLPIASQKGAVQKVLANLDEQEKLY
jgi:hypothetical protein